MRVVTAISLALIFYFNSTVFSQISNKESFSRHELNEKVLNMNTEKVKTVFENNMNSAITKSSKSPGLALLFSLVLPGAGHYYIDRMDVGKYYLGADAASWLGLATLNIYGNDVQKQSRVFSLEHAKTGNAEGKDDEYYANIGSYDNIYEYNNNYIHEKLDVLRIALEPEGQFNFYFIDFIFQSENGIISDHPGYIFIFFSN